MPSLKQIFSYRNNLLVYLLIVFLFNIFLINLPLTNVFGYEFSVFNSVLLTFISGFYIIFSVKKEEKFNKGSLKNLSNAALFFIALPFLVSIINSYFTGFCSFSDGLLFYLVITLPSIIIGYACGLTSFFFFRKFKKIIFVTLIIIILLVALGEFYFNPQVYFYNPVLGYLPGTIYDEGLSVDLKLIIYRLFNLIFFGGLLSGLLLHLSNKIRVHKIFFISWLVIIPALFIYFSPLLGYSTTFDKLKSGLGNAVSTEHFEIYIDKEIDDEFVKLLALHHEYYYNELKNYLKTIPSEKIKSFVFRERNQKRNLFGSANADIAKPWLYSIFTTYDNYNASLRHEIAHCFSAEFGEGPFKIAEMVNPFLVEGIAVAADPFYDDNDVDYLASVAFTNGYKVRLENMYKFSSFFTQTSSRSYIYAGSFTKYLIKNFGIEKFKQFYTDPDFLKVYNKSINELEKNYFSYLKTFKTAKEKAKAHYYFGRKSIFYKTCPRYIADRLEIAWNYFENKKYKEAAEIFASSLERSETYSAIMGLANTLAEMNRKDSSISVIKKYLENFENTAYQYNLEFYLADLYSETDNTAAADSIYKKLFTCNPNTTIYYLTDLRSILSDKENLLKDYLTAENNGKYSILKMLNQKNYAYSSFPVMIDLSKSLNEDYSKFTRTFDETFTVKNYLSAFGIYKLSEYMCEKLDFSRSRKMAALALRYKADYSFNKLSSENFRKLSWFYHNSDKVLNSITINGKPLSTD